MRSRKKKKNTLAICIFSLVLAAVFFVLGFYSGRSSTAVERAAAEEHYFTVTYIMDGRSCGTEEVRAGERPRGIGYPSENGQRVLLWQDSNGREAVPEELAVYSDLRYTAVTGPELRADPGYFPHTEEVFRPESPLTRGEAAVLLRSLLSGEYQPGDAELRDLEPETEVCEAASLLVSLGLMDAPGGLFSPEGSFTEESFTALLSPFFRAEELRTAAAYIAGVGSETVTRAEAAVVLNRLLGLEAVERDVVLPDVESGYWAEEAVKLAAAGGGSRRGAGFCNIDGYLYYIQEDGYALKNAYIGSLFFDGNGRYTSGDYELDDYVARDIRGFTTPDMTRDEMLRAMYLHVRDDFTYLRRNYYQVSDIRWVRSEAKTMYATGKGNCYCYAGAFWAAARGLGFDATAVSGTIGSERSPHGWVIIPIEGVHYVFDVEIEMAYHRDGNTSTDVYRIEHGQAVARWLYQEAYLYNQSIPREEEMGFAYR